MSIKDYKTGNTLVLKPDEICRSREPPFTSGRLFNLLVEVKDFEASKIDVCVSGDFFLFLGLKPEIHYLNSISADSSLLFAHQ